MDAGSDRKMLFLFYLTPEFTMLAFTSALEVLRLANQALGRETYRWLLVSADGEPVTASCGLSLAAHVSISEARRLISVGTEVRMAVVCAGENVHRYRDKSVDGWLRECRKKRIKLAALCTGPYLFAKAGLLEERRCTIHWEHYPAFAEEFPNTLPTSSIYEVDDGIYTCAGGTTSIEMMLEIVSSESGYDVAIEICQRAIVSGVRTQSERQRLPFSLAQGVKNDVVKSLIRIMEENLTEPLPLIALAKKVGISRRQMERHFQSHFGCSPGKYYVRLRLERAKSLLRQTSMPVVEVAVACGFISGSHFSRIYRLTEGKSPHQSRKPMIPDWAEAPRERMGA